VNRAALPLLCCIAAGAEVDSERRSSGGTNFLATFDGLSGFASFFRFGAAAPHESHGVPPSGTVYSSAEDQCEQRNNQERDRARARV
jgi:hypothetical protein